MLKNTEGKTPSGGARTCDPRALGPEPIWERILQSWEAHTGERLDPSGITHTLLGLRQPLVGELTPRHEEVFRALHAATIHVHTLTKEVNCLHGGNKVKQRTTAQLIGQIKKELTAMVAAWRERREPLESQGRRGKIRRGMAHACDGRRTALRHGVVMQQAWWYTY